MNKLLMVILALLIAVAISGCHGSDHSDNNTAVSSLAMTLGQEYELNVGDWIEADAAETPVVSVRHVFAEDKKYVTLISGSALLHLATQVVQ